MADNNLESLDNFSIQDTIDTGSGDQQLLHDLISPETSTAEIDDIKNIEEEKKVETKLPDETPKEKEVKKEDEKKLPSGEEIISSFLQGGDDDEEEEEEEEKTKPSDAPEKKSTPDDEEEEEESSPLESLAMDLYKLGVFTNDENDEETPIKTPEEFLAKFNAEKKKGAVEILDSFISKYGEDYKNAFEAIFVNGVDPKEYFGTYNEAMDFSQLNIEGDENKANQKKVIRQVLLDQGFEPDDIDAQVEQLENFGELETTAKRHQKVLVKKQALKLQEMENQSKQQQQQREMMKNQYAQNVHSILEEKLKAKEFDGIPINPQLANELQDFLVKDRYTTPSGELLTEFDRAILDLKRPENHEKKVKIALLLNLLEKDPTLSTIQKAGVTKKTNTMFENVAKHKTGTTKKQTTSQPSSWWK